MSDTPRIAVFDLDVTLTRYDTFLPFVVGFLFYQRKRRLLSVWRLLPCVLQVWRWRDFTWLKTRFLHAALGGQPRERVDEWAERFARRITQRALRSQGLVELRAHQAAGARVVLASASVDIYVESIARALAIDEVLATRSAWDARRRLTGIAGANCRDEEKLRRVKALADMPADGTGVTAYSDSHADIPLLNWAENGVAVCPSRRLFHQVAGLGLDVVRW